ncbi:kinase-like domain-containing protein [Gigaspora rosea]|uniref:Kinase-like domain-containing protein n=1 Tax=Gigaspora rosea TaxID=44941 RepID=A0A397UDK7_9GLOM|nr:kinase-like domain-containing protein [Gigaspora rosea]
MEGYEDAIIDLTKLLDIEINNNFALRYRGKAYYLMERYNEAIIDLTKLLDIEPNNKFALRNRADAYYLMEKYKESFNDVKKLLKIETNDELASKLLAKINENPCVDETYGLGCFYLHGINVEKDEYKAFVQFEKSANMGHTEGINCLGYCYEYGIGVEKNENKAFIYYQKSADMYNSNGMYQVGYYYYIGIGVDIDKHKAFTYYMKSAEAGNFMGIRKTAICYYFGIGVEINENKYYEWNEKSSKYGNCAHCNEYNTQPAWCLSCDPDKTTRWTSGNKDIDDYIKAFQIRTLAYEDVIEWIPFDRLSSVEVIGKGGFGSVYKATWLDGIRKVEKIDGNYKRALETSGIVALKSLSRGSLKEFENHMKCILYNCQLKIYGLTQNIKNEYFMVFQYADSGNLNKFLRTKFHEVTWKTKLKLLFDISKDLYRIHDAGYIHADFHSGNILQDQHISTTLQSYIADLGLSKKDNENGSEGEIYGVMPYVAPEVLSGQKFTKAADIYGFGVIMSEMSTGQRPFDGHEFDHILAVKICNGLRPEFAPGTPDCYIELANQCMNLGPQKRPNAYEIWDILEEWNISIENSDDTSNIKKQFLDADKIVKTLPLNLQKHPDFMYTSKIINTKKILNEINGTYFNKFAILLLKFIEINFDLCLASRSMEFVEMPNGVKRILACN